MTQSYKAEKRTEYIVPEEMKRVWHVEMELLKQLLDVCRQYNLRCWMDGGSLLGTVRHHGFIPWDDDIDVCMPRPDYDRLVGLSHQAFQEPYFLQSVYSEDDYFRGHAQLRRSGTAAIRPSESYRSFHQGIFIDIFPLDGVPTNEKDCQETLKAIRYTYKMLKAEHLNVFFSGRWGQVFRKLKSRRYIQKYGRIPLFAHTELLLRCTPTDQSDYWAELAFSGTDIVLRREIFDETVWMPFENMQVPVPKGFDELLTTQYGADYMTPRQDPSYHGEIVFSTTRDYREVAPEVFRAYKWSALSRLFKKLFRK